MPSKPPPEAGSPPLGEIVRAAVARAAAAASAQEVAQLRADVVGKRGSLGQALRALGQLSEAERPAAGVRLHEAKQQVEAALTAAGARLADAADGRALLAGAYDVSRPGRRLPAGAPHPLRQVEADIVDFLETLGFAVAQGPQVEHDWYNFEALNIAPDHPARDMQDTFFVAPRVVLRTHTSNVQVRTMLQRQPPVRILAPGMVFRHDEVDATHSPAFHQVEGLWVDDRATFADLKGVLRALAMHLFGPQARTRLRPSFFPFTEPSAEVDVSCSACAALEGSRARACRVCRGTGWLEILGAGMVDPAVLGAVGYDADRVQGFAFGIGIERVAMLRHDIDDLRLFYENDLRFLHGLTASVP